MGSFLALALLITLRPDLSPAALIPQSFASREHLALLDGTWTTYANGDAVQALAVQGDVLWVGTYLGGLVRWDTADETYTQFLYPQTNLPSNNTRAVDIDALRRVWVGTDRGLAVLSPEGGTIVVHDTSNSSVPADDITDIGVAEDGRLWVATNGGVGVLDDKGTTENLADDMWTVYGLADGLPSYLATALDFDEVGNVWIGTRPYPNPDPGGGVTLGGGVSIFNGTSFFNYHTHNSRMGSDTVVAVCAGGGEKMWVATRGGGVTLFQGRQGNETYNKNTPGLPGNDISACTQDPSGRTWFAVADRGTPRGVAVLSDSVWANMTRDSSGLVSNSVSAIAADSSHRVWFGHREVYGGLQGVSMLAASGANWRTYNASTGTPSLKINSITQDTVGNLWFGTSDRGAMVYLRAVNRWGYYDRIITGGGLPSNIVRDIAVDQLGRLWLATDRGGSVRSGSWTAYTRISTGDNLRTDDLTTVAVDATGKVWFGHAQGIDQLDHRGTPSNLADDSWSRVTAGLPGPNVRDIVRDSLGRMWVATNGGLGRYDNTGWTTYRTPYLISNNAQTVYPDARSGQVWVGTDRGVSVLDERSSIWTSYTTSDGLVDNNVKAIAVDAWRRVWLATDRGVSIKDGESWSTYTSANSGLVSNYVSSLFVDGWGLVWLGTRSSGVSTFDGTSWDHLTTADHGLPSNRITDIVFGADSQVWVGTADRGLATLVGTTWTTYSRASATGQLASDKVHSIAIADDGRVWVGTVPYVSGGWWTGGGVSALEPQSGSWTTYDKSSTGPTGLQGNFIQKVAVDAVGRVWIGTGVPRDEPTTTLGYGLTVFDHGSWTTYTRGNTGLGLSSDRIADVALDSQGGIWLATQPYAAGASLDGGGVTHLTLGPNGVPDPPMQGDDVWTSWTNDDSSGLVAAGARGDILTIHIDRPGTVWAGAWTFTNESSIHWPNRQGVHGSLNQFVGPHWVAYQPFSETGPVTTIASNAANGLWVGTSWDGARYFDGKGWQLFTTAEYPLVSNDTTVIRVDPQGDVWFGTADGGISRYTPPPPTPTPTSTATPGPLTVTATPTATATGTPTAPATGTPTAPAAQTGTATATPAPSSTPTLGPHHRVHLPGVWK